jgi:hypothetical protein
MPTTTAAASPPRPHYSSVEVARRSGGPRVHEGGDPSDHYVQLDGANGSELVRKKKHLRTCPRTGPSTTLPAPRRRRPSRLSLPAARRKKMRRGLTERA